MHVLPECDELFTRFFAPWYSEDDWSHRQFKATLPDLLTAGALIGSTETEISALPEEMRRGIAEQFSAMLDAVRSEWPSYLPVSGEITLDWIAAYDHFFDRRRVTEVIEASDPAQFSNKYVVLCCEFGVTLGHVLRIAEPRLIWRFEWPYWDSALLDPETGVLINVFHWAIKKMSEYGVDDGFAAKVKAALTILEQERH